MTNTAHYVDNKKFLAALIEHKNNVNDAIQRGEEPPIISNYIGECFIKISNHLSYRYNFINYSFKDEMVLDGIENCLAVVSNFDPEKSSNPFAYFTQICFYAFVRRIQKEKKQQKAKYKILESADLDSIITQSHEDGEFDAQFLDFIKKQLEYRYDNSDDVPEKKAAPKSKKVELPFD